MPNYQAGDIVHYQSPYYGRELRVRVTGQIVTHDGKAGFDAVIIDEHGDPDIAGYFFTEVWGYDYQITRVETLPFRSGRVRQN